MPTLPFAVIPTPLGTIATGNERAEKPASHLGEFKAPGMTWKSNGNSNLWIRGDFGTAKPIDFVSMLAANALPGTTFRINLASTQTDVDGPGFRAISDNGNTTTVNLSGPYSVEKTSGADGAYNASAVSLASISGDFVLRIKPVTTNKDMFFGVNTDPLTDNTNSSIDRAIYFPGNPALGARVWENGVQLFTGPAYSTSQYWFIRRIGSTITYLVGTSTDVDEATLVYTGASSSAAMHFDSAISGLNGKAEVYFTHGGYDSGEVPFINPSITREDGLYHSHIELPKKVSQRWWRIDISGHTGDFEAVVVKETSNGIADGLHFYDWLFIDSNGRTGKIRSGRATKQGTYTEI